MRRGRFTVGSIRPRGRDLHEAPASRGAECSLRDSRDSDWAPEPELTLFATSSGKIVAYTIGNACLPEASKAKTRSICPKPRP